MFTKKTDESQNAWATPFWSEGDIPADNSPWGDSCLIEQIQVGLVSRSSRILAPSLSQRF